MENVQRIVVEIDGEKPFEYIIAKEGEANSRIVEVELFEKSVAYIIPSGVKAMIKYRKPDGKKVLNDCTYTENIVTVTYTEQMLAVYGTGKGEIMLVKDNEIIKSATFWTKVVQTVYKENGLISDDEFQSLAGTLIEVNETLQKIDNAVTGAETALYEAQELKEQCETATEAAEEATLEANTAAEAYKETAENVTNQCNTAITNVNTAIEAAEEATQEANTAAGACMETVENVTNQCNAAITNVNTAIEAAEKATLEANTAAEACKETAENVANQCDTAITNVNTSMEAAVENINSAINTAEISAENANAAAEKCNDIIDGLKPRIGSDGNWYVGQEDTGVKANGGITVYDGFDSDSTTNAASARTVKELKTELDEHTHTKSQITDFPESLKNPAALTLSLNGTSQGAYDGSAAKSINITPSGIGAAASSHTHNYAGSSSAGGPANSAVKLNTARTITIGNQSNTFDGSSNISFNASSMGLVALDCLELFYRICYTVIF